MRSVLMSLPASERTRRPLLCGAGSIGELLADMTEEEFEALFDLVAADEQWWIEPFGKRYVPTRRGLTGRFVDDRLARASYYMVICVDSLATLAESIRYLGPLRDTPRLVSPLGQGARSTPVGITG